VGILIRASIAVGVAGVFSDVVSHFFGLPHFAFRWFAISLLILPIFTYALRRFYVHASRHLRPPQNIVVIGSVGDTEILVVGIERVHPRYRLVGKLHPDLALSHRLETQAHARPLTELRAARGDVPAWNFNSAGTAVAMVREKVSPADVTEVNRSVEVTPDLGPATRENLLRVVAECEVNVVVVRSEVMTIELAGTLTRLRFNGIQVYSMLDFCMHTSEELPLAILNEFWLCVADGFDLLQARFFRHLKRLIDIFLALVGLLVSLPLLLLAALAIRLDSPGPVLFRQRRIGWMGRPFELLKFRSMRAEAEKDSGPQWAAQDDPRITFVGNILRKTHFDELPQMINILRGQMSFVGPRPERPEFVGPLSDAINFYHLRHYVLPGITGWAQVNYPYGASLEDARRKLQYDLYYVCNASPLLDLRTLLRTARVVIFRQGSR
jgi:exopolysaccharide biosynthesis polyprenyl glycosylphosphotransferase